jgi:hypothetical protein
MTSANVVEYNIYDKDNNEVGYHRQNVMCSTCNDGLDKYQPLERLYYNGIWLWWGEDYWQDSMNLENGCWESSIYQFLEIWWLC